MTLFRAAAHQICRRLRAGLTSSVTELGRVICKHVTLMDPVYTEYPQKTLAGKSMGICTGFQQDGLWNENEACPGRSVMGSRFQLQVSLASHPHGNLLCRLTGIDGQAKWIHMTEKSDRLLHDGQSRSGVGNVLSNKQDRITIWQGCMGRELGIPSNDYLGLLSHCQPPFSDYGFSWGDLGADRQVIRMDSC